MSKGCKLLKSMLKSLSILKIKFVTQVFYFYKQHILWNDNFKVQLYFSKAKPIHVFFLLHFTVT